MTSLILFQRQEFFELQLPLFIIRCLYIRSTTSNDTFFFTSFNPIPQSPDLSSIKCIPSRYLRRTSTLPSLLYSVHCGPSLLLGPCPLSFTFHPLWKHTHSFWWLWPYRPRLTPSLHSSLFIPPHLPWYLPEQSIPLLRPKMSLILTKDVVKETWTCIRYV